MHDLLVERPGIEEVVAIGIDRLDFERDEPDRSRVATIVFLAADILMPL